MSTSSRLRLLLHRLHDDPISAVTRIGQLARARLAFRGFQVGEGVSATGWVRAEGPGRIELAPGTLFVGGMVPTEVLSHQGATIRIGAGGMVNYGVSLEARQAITIGERCLLASFVRVSDDERGRRGPVVIGDDVWLAHGVIVEPGVTIGSGSVVAAGSVVTEDVPPGSLASGNPAQSARLLASREKPLAMVEARAWQAN
jgi:maltose O-acetyltransferase